MNRCAQLQLKRVVGHGRLHGCHHHFLRHHCSRVDLCWTRWPSFQVLFLVLVHVIFANEIQTALDSENAWCVQRCPIVAAMKVLATGKGATNIVSSCGSKLSDSKLFT